MTATTKAGPGQDNPAGTEFSGTDHHWEDRFSAVAGDYARYRPHYPAALFAYLAAQCPRHDHAWDCATGNGQAARALAAHFQHITATDASAQQIQQAVAHPRVAYHCAHAEASGLAGRSVDLVTVAQALHWFELDGFYHEVKRVLRPGGVIAVWSYATLHIAHAELQRIVDHYYRVTLAPYWPPQRRLVEEGYRSLPFPFNELNPPEWHMQSRWNLPTLTGYLSTWSATQKYRADHPHDPFPELCRQLATRWPQNQPEVAVSWPLNLRLGRMDAEA